MNQNDYVILFDENGTPYIAHADISAIKNKVNNIVNNVKARAKGYQIENHKYYMRIDDPTSSKEAYRLAQKLKNTADRELEIAQNDIAYLEEQLTKDNNAYKSAVQVYNTYLYINDRKNK